MKKRKRDWRMTARMYDMKYKQEVSVAEPHWPKKIKINKKKIRLLARRKKL